MSSVGPNQRIPRIVSAVPGSGIPGDFIFDTATNASYIANNAGAYQVLDTGSSDITGSGTANTVAKFTGSGSIGNSVLTDDGSALVYSGANGIVAPNLSPGLLSTATAAGTTTLTVASKGIQVFTGATTQTVVLPVVATLPQIGFGFVIQNDSSGALTVNSSGGNLVQTVAAGARATVTCKLLTGTTAASWNVTYLPASFGITNSAGANIVPKSNGSNLVASQISDDGSNVVIATNTTITGSTATFDVDITAPSVSTTALTTGGSGILPAIAATGNIGSAGMPYPSVFIGDAANESIQITSAPTANRVATLPDATGNVMLTSFANANLTLDKTITGGGTVGAQTINKPAGSVNFAASATTLVVTNSLVATSSMIFVTVATNDTTATIKNAVAAAGSFTITLTAAATAETRVNFLVIN